MRPQIQVPWIFVAILFLAAPSLIAQQTGEPDWEGSLRVSITGQSSSGNEESLRTQTDLRSGVSLEELSLRSDLHGLRLEASGFGNAEPSERLRLSFDRSGDWFSEIEYASRTSFFDLSGSTVGPLRDQWSIDNWSGRVGYRGASLVDMTLDLRHVDRSGTTIRPFFALNELYPILVELDQNMTEAGITFDTKSLPVRLTLEQSWAVYERNDALSILREQNIAPADPDLLDRIETDRNEEIDVPTTRLSASWGKGRVEMVGTALWSPADLDSQSFTSTSFLIGGGELGRIGFDTDIRSAAERDTLAADLRLGYLIAPGLTLRASSGHRESETDGLLLGRQILRASNPAGGAFELIDDLDHATIFNVTDGEQKLELEWSRSRWTLRAGVFTTDRDVSWRLGESAEPFGIERTAEGTVLGIGYGHPRLNATLDWERGDFEDFVFRRDPEQVDRVRLRVRADLGSGVQLSLGGRLEESENPVTIAGLDRSSESYNAGLFWTGLEDRATAGITLDHTDLTTETGLVLPSGQPGLSLYDLELLTTTGFLRYRLGKIDLDATLARVADDGTSWPLESWNSRARVAYQVLDRLSLGVFGEYWSYDEDRENLDDFDVTRYGVSLGWRFER